MTGASVSFTLHRLEGVLPEELLRDADLGLVFLSDGWSQPSADEEPSFI